MQPGSLLAIGDAAAILEDSVADKGKNKPKLLAHRRTMDFGSHRDGEKSSSSSTSTSVASKGSGSAAPSSSSPKEQRQQQQPRRAPLPATAQVPACTCGWHYSLLYLLLYSFSLDIAPFPNVSVRLRFSDLDLICCLLCLRLSLSLHLPSTLSFKGGSAARCLRSAPLEPRIQPHRVSETKIHQDHEPCIAARAGRPGNAFLLPLSLSLYFSSFPQAS